MPTPHNKMHDEVLNVPVTATEKIKTSYKKLTLKYHQEIYKSPATIKEFQGKATASAHERTSRRKTVYTNPNAGYRGNFEVPPRDVNPSFYSTERGFFYKKQNINHNEIDTKRSTVKSRFSK